MSFSLYRGRTSVAVLIRAVSQVFEDFRYVRQKGAEGAADHALVFRARIGDRDLEGCDFVHIDEHGAIDELAVMIRPLSAAVALAEAMKSSLRRSENHPSAL